MPNAANDNTDPARRIRMVRLIGTVAEAGAVARHTVVQLLRIPEPLLRHGRQEP